MRYQCIRCKKVYANSDGALMCVHSHIYEEDCRLEEEHESPSSRWYGGIGR